MRLCVISDQNGPYYRNDRNVRQTPFAFLPERLNEVCSVTSRHMHTYTPHTHVLCIDVGWRDVWCEEQVPAAWRPQHVRYSRVQCRLLGVLDVGGGICVGGVDIGCVDVCVYLCARPSVVLVMFRYGTTWVRLCISASPSTRELCGVLLCELQCVCARAR